MPGIKKGARKGVKTDFEATDAGAMTRRWVVNAESHVSQTNIGDTNLVARQQAEVGSQIETLEIAVNTDTECRNIGVSTRDDVIYVYEPVSRHHDSHRRYRKHDEKHHHTNRIHFCRPNGQPNSATSSNSRHAFSRSNSTQPAMNKRFLSPQTGFIADSTISENVPRHLLQNTNSGRLSSHQHVSESPQNMEKLSNNKLKTQQLIRPAGRQANTKTK